MVAMSRIWTRLEQSNPTVFLIGGVLLLSYAVLEGVSAFAGMEPQTALKTGYGGIVLLVPVFALLGLYPHLHEHTPRLSRAGLVTTILSGFLTLVLLVWLVGVTLQMDGLPEIPADAPVWTAAALLLGFLLLAVSFLLFGLASLRTPVVSRTVALLLLVPAAGWFGLMVANVVLPSGDYLGFAAYTPISVAVLAIGYLLRTTAVSPDNQAPGADTTAR